MIQLQDISLSFGGQPILDRLNWSIPPGVRIGLIGKNGAGKSTLLRLITGQMRPDEGRVIIGGKTSIGYLEQDVQALDSEATILDSAMEAFAELRELEREEARIMLELEAHQDHGDPLHDRLIHALDRVHTLMAAQEAHLARPKAESVLTGLGFDPDDFDRAVKTFSGGWRMRVTLARLLLRRPDYLLLDEPTNHLDIESIDWLENYLRSYDGTVVIVSHDRYFLDRMINRIAELAHGQVQEYAGNYTFYLQERESRRALQQSAYENQQREIEQIERFVDRFRAKATKARQVQSRVKLLEKMELIPAPPTEEATVTIRFPEPKRSGKVVLELSEFSKTYVTEDGTIRVFEKAGPLTIERGDKIALIGKNGAGKSTLARIINGTEPFDGSRSLGYNVEMSFFAQHQAETLNPSHSILESMQATGAEKSEREIRSILGAFLFTGDDAFKKISVLSGGERSRVALARALLTPANFFILDEPTNHLDAQSIAVLIEALQQYTGTLVVVSHDRHFLDQISNRVWYAADRTVHTYIGNYSDYRWQAEHGTSRISTNGDAARSPRSEESSQEEPARSGGPKTKEQKRREAEERNRLHRERQQGSVRSEGLSESQLRKHYQSAEENVLRLEVRLAEIEKELADPAVYGDGSRMKELMSAYEKTKADLDAHYATWEKLAAQIAAREGA